MADDNTNNAQAHDQPPQPNPDLKKLARLVGTWEMSGEVRGRVSFGHERPFGAEPRARR